MKKDNLRQLIKETGADEPAEEFGRRLAHQVITSYGYRQAKPVQKDWVGKAIIAMLIGLNTFMLVRLDPFQTQPVLCYATAGFLLAFGCVLAWLKRQPTLPK